jgi:NAD(P)H-nitrite reductase large subunit
MLIKRSLAIAVFHLQQSVVSIDERKVTLKDGHTIEAGLVVIGVGAKPLTDLAERAGIETDRGVLAPRAKSWSRSTPWISTAGTRSNCC